VIKLVIVDDQILVRSGIRQLLASVDFIEVVGEAADAGAAVQVIRATEPDLVLLDVRMPGGSGIDVLKALSSERLPPTILLTTFDDDEALIEGIRHGAKGFLLKDISFERLIDAIRQVAAGGDLIRPIVTERVTRGVRDIGTSFESFDLPESLTPRELAVLRLMAGGFNNREIAQTFRHKRRYGQEPGLDHTLQIRRAQSRSRGLEGHREGLCLIAK
jgi:DNA-binding NarL/FixJ family response regulator